MSKKEIGLKMKMSKKKQIIFLIFLKIASYSQDIYNMEAAGVKSHDYWREELKILSKIGSTPPSEN